MNSQPIMYALSGMEITQFAMMPENSASGKEFEATVSINPIYDFATNTMSLDLLVDYTEDNKLTLRAELRSLFKIHEDSVAAMTTTEGKIVIPRSLMIQLLSLAYGTMRGVILAKTAGTPMSCNVLPPHDIGATFNTPIEFTKPS